MKIRAVLLVCAALAGFGLFAVFLGKSSAVNDADSSVKDAEAVTELEWEALMPPDWRPESLFEQLSTMPAEQIQDSSEEADKLMAEMRQIWNSAPVVEALNGKRVRLPGYVVPLEFDVTQVSEFLLVPYFGACIHVPPPPSNQIVYVKTQEAYKIDGLFAAVWVTGTLTTSHVDSKLAGAGYTLDAQQIAPYEEQAR